MMMVAIHVAKRVHLILALVAVAVALCVATLHPELKQLGGECAGTEAVTMGTHGMLLFLSASAQVAVAMVAAFPPPPWRQLHVTRAFASLANGINILTCFHFVCASADVAVVALDRCPGHLLAYKAMFIAHILLLTARDRTLLHPRIAP